MKNVKVVTKCHGTHAIVSLANPLAQLGNNADASTQIRQINNVPDDVPDSQVVALWRNTADITWMGGREGRLEFDYSELGIGKIIRN